MGQSCEKSPGEWHSVLRLSRSNPAVPLRLKLPSVSSAKRRSRRSRSKESFQPLGFPPEPSRSFSIELQFPRPGGPVTFEVVLGQDVLQDRTADVGQAEVTTGVAVGELGMVDAH